MTQTIIIEENTGSILKEQKYTSQSVCHMIRDIFNCIDHGIIAVDGLLNVVESNPAVEAICGMPPDSLRGKPLEKVRLGCSGKCLDYLKRTLDSPQSVQESLIDCGRVGRPDQRVTLKITPFRADGLESDGAVLVIRNVTRLLSPDVPLSGHGRFYGMVGRNIRMQKIYTLIEDLSGTETAVLITGESGTGKELVARAIHQSSLRHGNPFVTVNCGALSESLLESELFGHVKGAFTGAIRDRKGRFETADQGTLFLDEIGDISPLVQLKLLRILQEKQFERVGDSTQVKANVRIVAATNRDLKSRVQSGLFREDLYYRIKVMEITLPALRDRRGDIPMLAGYFAHRFNKTFGKNIKGFSKIAMTRFMTYSWPGNIREFKHAIEHAFVVCKGDIICTCHLPSEIKDNEPLVFTEMEKGEVMITRQTILDALKKTGWNKAGAARTLGISRRTIYRKIESFGIVPALD